ncbi:CoA transferase [Nonomuraea harbinensis]|uniref:CoA transferase n=1 Tax=Nonomuraea harbinensis TaxID=1286938 RepID=A0ABW1C2W9_9ACTN|nr:CoA transferase [Nonomuraea harbinensis]
MSGFCELTGWPDRGPGSPYGAYTDFIAQRFAAAAVITALERRDRTGEGQYIDLSQMETALMFLAPELVDHQRTGRVATRDGNRSRGAAPHGVFPCLPEDGRERWVAIAATSDAEWAAPCAGRWATPDGRRMPASAPWPGARSRRTGSKRSSPPGRAPAPPPRWSARSSRACRPGRCTTPGGSRPTRRWRTGATSGGTRTPSWARCPYEGAQAEMSLTPHRVTKAAPLLGEDNEKVLTALLGFSRAEVAELAASGTLEQVLD